MALAGIAWWALSITLAVAAALASTWRVRHRLRRVNRLLSAGRTAEALRVYAAVQRDMGAKRREDPR